MAVTDREGVIGGPMKEEHTRTSAKPGFHSQIQKGSRWVGEEDPTRR